MAPPQSGGALVRPTTISFLDNGSIEGDARVYDRMLLYTGRDGRKAEDKL
jgi:hypothetical protein